jgi:hypothetical protein
MNEHITATNVKLSGTRFPKAKGAARREIIEILSIWRDGEENWQFGAIVRRWTIDVSNHKRAVPSGNMNISFFGFRLVDFSPVIAVLRLCLFHVFVQRERVSEKKKKQPKGWKKKTNFSSKFHGQTTFDRKVEGKREGGWVLLSHKNIYAR